MTYSARNRLAAAERMTEHHARFSALVCMWDGTTKCGGPVTLVDRSCGYDAPVPMCTSCRDNEETLDHA